MVFRKPKSAYVDLGIPEGDTKVKEWYGCVLDRGLSNSGALITLTSNHLMIAPFDLKPYLKIYELLGKSVPSGEILNKGAKALVENTGIQDNATVSLGDIVKVVAGSNASLFRPPTAMVTLKDGSCATLGFVMSPKSPNILRGNNVIRDDFVSTLTAILAL